MDTGRKIQSSYARRVRSQIINSLASVEVEDYTTMLLRTGFYYTIYEPMRRTISINRSHVA